MKVSKAQKLVNDIDSRYGIDVSQLTEGEVEELIEALDKLKDLDLDDVVSPGDFFDDEDEFGDQDPDIHMEDDDEGEDY